MLLKSSADQGQAFIQTSSLDGEKNLKKREVISGLRFEERGHNSIFGFKAMCECDTPNKDLYRFKGKVISQGETYFADEMQLLLKGSVLKNVEWIQGFVVYAGAQSKLMLNA